LENQENQNEEVIDAAVALWCSLVRNIGMEVENAELKIVLGLIPTPRDTLALVDQLRFVVYAVERWPGVFTDLGNCGWILFQTMELIFQLFTANEIAFFGRALREEDLAVLGNETTDDGIHLVQERLTKLFP
jgi:hypothetical protein